MLNWVEYEKCFITSGPGYSIYDVILFLFRMLEAIMVFYVNLRLDGANTVKFRY